VSTRFVLASASPARLATLRAAGLDPVVVVSHVDEEAISAAMPGASTAQIVAALAEAKAAAVASTVAGPVSAGEQPPALVLGCDSMLDIAGRAYGKPLTTAAAVERWRHMRGQRGQLYTGHCLIDVATGRSAVEAVGTQVHFADVTDAEIKTYCGTGEPTQVAGAFTIDGLGGWFVESIVGDHHNVVGVSLPVVRRLLRELGHDLESVGYPVR
jgi:septum formation protein